MSDELRIEYIKLSELRKYSRNAKDHDLGLLHESIARFGFKDPMAIDEATGMLVEGHGRLETLTEQYMAGDSLPQHLKAIDGEWAAPVIRGLTFKDDMERRAYTIATNRTTEAGGWHEELLLDELKTIAEAGVQLDGIGYDGDDLDQMIADAEFAAKQQSAAAPPPPDPPAQDSGDSSPQFGVVVRVSSAEEEETLAHLLALNDYEPKRFSEDK